MVRVKEFTKSNQGRERNKWLVRKSNNVSFLHTKLFFYLKIAVHNLAHDFNCSTWKAEEGGSL